jgi:predicted nucleic acid-binding protein
VVLVDTNVLVDVLADDPVWGDLSINQLRSLSKVHSLAVNPIIYAELSATFSNLEDLDASIETLQLEMLEMPRPALFLAAKAFVRYGDRGGAKHYVLANFFIGAHAAVSGLPLLTRDIVRYKTYFPTIEVISPP